MPLFLSTDISIKNTHITIKPQKIKNGNAQYTTLLTLDVIPTDSNGPWWIAWRLPNPENMYDWWSYKIYDRCENMSKYFKDNNHKPPSASFVIVSPEDMAIHCDDEMHKLIMGCPNKNQFFEDNCSYVYMRFDIPGLYFCEWSWPGPLNWDIDVLCHECKTTIVGIDNVVHEFSELSGEMFFDFSRGQKMSLTQCNIQ